MIRVLVVDDHVVVRRGLRQILEQAEDIAVTGEAGTAADARQRLAEAHFDVAILDISLKDDSGLDVLREMRRTHPRLPAIMLSVYSEEQYAIRSFRTGASGYLTKDSAPDQLIEAVRKVVRGGKWVSPALAEKLASVLGPGPEAAPHEQLSHREFEVLRSLGAGKTVSEIAEQLGLSVKTVSTYRTRILEKLGLRTTAELMHYALKNGLA